MYYFYVADESGVYADQIVESDEKFPSISEIKEMAFKLMTGAEFDAVSDDVVADILADMMISGPFPEFKSEWLGLVEESE